MSTVLTLSNLQTEEQTCIHVLCNSPALSTTPFHPPPSPLSPLASVVTVPFLLPFLHSVITAVVAVPFLLPFLHSVITAFVAVLFLLPFLHSVITAVVAVPFLLPFLHSVITAVVAVPFLLPFLHSVITAVVAVPFLLPYILLSCRRRCPIPSSLSTCCYHSVVAVYIFLPLLFFVSFSLLSFLFVWFCFFVVVLLFFGGLTPLYSLHILNLYLCVYLMYVCKCPYA